MLSLLAMSLTVASHLNELGNWWLHPYTLCSISNAPLSLLDWPSEVIVDSMVFLVGQYHWSSGAVLALFCILYTVCCSYINTLPPAILLDNLKWKYMMLVQQRLTSLEVIQYTPHIFEGTLLTIVCSFIISSPPVGRKANVKWLLSAQDWLSYLLMCQPIFNQHVKSDHIPQEFIVMSISYSNLVGNISGIIPMCDLIPLYNVLELH